MPSFPAFFQQWADEVGWDVPDFHLEVCDWLEHRGRLALLKIFRGASKSTIMGRYVPWRLKENPAWRFLLMSATDQDGAKLSADSRFVIQQHPWTQGMRERGGLWKTHRFMVKGATDYRNPSVSAFGIMSNMTGGRCDEAIMDDVEVPKTIATPQLRESLRHKLEEVTHILVPGGSKLYVGTDHCHDSLYKELQEKGADSLILPLFAKKKTHIASGDEQRYAVPWRVPVESDLMVHMNGRFLDPSEYQAHRLAQWKGGFITLPQAPARDTEVRLYTGNIWANRFTREEVAFKRAECRTQGAWDSQYDLEAKPFGEQRLDPARIIEYRGEPEYRTINGAVSCWINGTRMVGAVAKWDPSLGKIKSDASAFTVVFTDAAGFLYWHVAVDCKGDIDRQCQQVVRYARALQLGAIRVETNGVGGHVPAILRKHLLAGGLATAVVEVHETQNKNKKILDAFESPLSGMYLHATPQVIETVATQMREWDPKVLDQPDDFLDSGSDCILATPVRIGNVADHIRQAAESPKAWRSHGGTYDAQIDL